MSSRAGECVRPERSAAEELESVRRGRLGPASGAPLASTEPEPAVDEDGGPAGTGCPGMLVLDAIKRRRGQRAGWWWGRGRSGRG